MDRADTNFVRIFFSMIGGLFTLAIIFIIAGNLLGEHLSATQPESAKQIAWLEGKRVEPVGEVEAADESALLTTTAATAEGSSESSSGASNARSGKEVVAQVCSACHATGLMGAPKIGSKADWRPRIKAGLDTLVHHALHGYGKMPPQKSVVSKAEERAAIKYMVEVKTGLDISSAAGAASSAAGAASSAAGAASSGANGQKVVANVCSACHATGLMGAPKIGNKSAWKPRIKAGLDTLVQHALHGYGAMPAQGGVVSAAQARAAIKYMVVEKTGLSFK